MAWRITNLKTEKVEWNLNKEEPVTQNGHEFLMVIREGGVYGGRETWSHLATCAHPDHAPDREKPSCCHKCKCR